MMTKNLIEVEHEATAVASGRRVGVKALNLGDYCRLAEECFFLAAVAKDAATAAELVKAGDEYLRCAAAAD
jgi:hypothetical protein